MPGNCFPNNHHAGIETAGELLSDDRVVEPVAGRGTRSLELLVRNGQAYTLASRVDCEGRTYVPPHLDPFTLRAMRFPSQANDYGSTEKLFGELKKQFEVCGFPEEVATTASYFLFGTWFSDCLPVAPCLLVAGPRTEASFVFQLLASLVRHPLQVVEFNLRRLAEVMRTRPTLLIDQELFRPTTLKMIWASNYHGSYVPHRHGLVDFCCAKAVYTGITIPEDYFDHPVLHVVLTPLRREPPVLDVKQQDIVAGRFQPMLLDYRLRNIRKVCDSGRDFPEFSLSLRILARILQ